MSQPTSKLPIILGVSALGLGLLAIVNKSTIEAVVDHAVDELEGSMDWVKRVLHRVSSHEGNYDSLNLNADGAGLSFGILQWAQKPGSLHSILSAMNSADPQLFLNTFGASSKALLMATKAASLAPVGGAVLWQEPWVSRFKKAGREPLFKDVQDRMATEGQYFQAALQCGEILKISTERAITLFMDTAVQQGPGAARKIAKRLQSSAIDKSNYIKVLERYAQECAVGFRRTTAPTGPHPASHLEWRQVPGKGEWHVWAGKFNLYTGIRKRRFGIVNDPTLSDATIEMEIS